MLLAICTNQVKKKKCYEKFASREFEPGPSNQLELKPFYPLLFFSKKSNLQRGIVSVQVL